MTALEIVLVCVTGAGLAAAAAAVGWARALLVNKSENYTELNKVAKTGGTVFLGDSLVEFFPLREFFADEIIYNRGCAGDTTADVTARLSNVTDIAPSRIFLLIGTNDLGKGTAPDEVADRVKNLCSALLSAIPGLQLNVISLLPVSRRVRLLSPLVCARRTNEKLMRINYLLKKYCEGNRLNFIEVYPHLTDDAGDLKKEYTFEGLHLSITGYLQFAKVLRPYICEGRTADSPDAPPAADAEVQLSEPQ